MARRIWLHKLAALCSSDVSTQLTSDVAVNSVDLKECCVVSSATETRNPWLPRVGGDSTLGVSWGGGEAKVSKSFGGHGSRSHGSSSTR
jgi:hypothetical protein